MIFKIKCLLWDYYRFSWHCNCTEILYILYPVFPNGQILQTYSIMSQPEYWYWNNQGTCIGLNTVSLPKVSLLEFHNMTLLGNKVVANIFSWWGPAALEWALNPMTGVVIRRPCEDIQRRKPWRNWSNAATLFLILGKK